MNFMLDDVFGLLDYWVLWFCDIGEKEVGGERMFELSCC